MNTVVDAGGLRTRGDLSRHAAEAQMAKSGEGAKARLLTGIVLLRPPVAARL